MIKELSMLREASNTEWQVRSRAEMTLRKQISKHRDEFLDANGSEWRRQPRTSTTENVEWTDQVERVQGEEESKIDVGAAAGSEANVGLSAT